MLHDGLAERRNLMVTSLLFIAYFYGEGVIRGDSLKFPMVNVEFTHTGFLVFFAYSLFIWFIYRYWLAARGLFKTDFRKQYLKNSKTKSYLRKYAGTQYVLTKFSPAVPSDEVKNMVITTELVQIRYPHTGISFNFLVHVTKNDQLVSSTSSTPIEIRGKWIRLRLVLSAITIQSAFTDYVIPYILAIVALLGFILAPISHRIFFAIQQWIYC